MTETMEVNATLDALNQTNGEIGGVVEAPQIREIPTDGRNWATLMTLAPGAINTGDGAQGSIRFNGHSLDDSNFAFDGIDTSGVQEQTQKADTRLNVSLDSIVGFRVSSAAYTAESGAAGGCGAGRALRRRNQRRRSGAAGDDVRPATAGGVQKVRAHADVGTKHSALFAAWNAQIHVTDQIEAPSA